MVRKRAEFIDGAGKVVGQVVSASNALSGDSDYLSQALYALSETIIRGVLPEQRGGGLGGEFGYGANFENDVFMMHPDCWCEKPDCLWCAVWLSNEIDCTEKEAEAHRDKQTLEIREHYGDGGAKCPQAPHFWHKPSGFQVRWYKWIGRDMEISRDISGSELASILTECFESIPQEARDRAEAEAAYESTPEFIAEQEKYTATMLAVMRQMLNERQPCFTCSEVPGFGLEGTTYSRGDIKIVSTTKRDDGACVNCGHITSPAETANLDQRLSTINAELSNHTG